MTFNFKRFEELMKEEDKRLLNKFPLLDKKKKGKQLERSITNGRVTFDEGYFYLWVYPNVKSAVNAYDFSCNSYSELCTKWMPHLVGKVWFSIEMMDELFKPGQTIFDDGERL